MPSCLLLHHHSWLVRLYGPICPRLMMGILSWRGRVMPLLPSFKLSVPQRSAGHSSSTSTATLNWTQLINSSFAVYRPLLGLAIHTILSMLAALPSSPLISLPHVTTVLRSTYEAIASARPLDLVPASPARISLLAELVEGGSGVMVAIGKREVLGVELGSGLWKRILG